MAEDDGQEKTLDASPRKLEEARKKGDVPISREGAVFGLYAAMLLAIFLAGGTVATAVGTALLPMLEQPDAFLELEFKGYEMAGDAVMRALAIAIAPVFGLLVLGALGPYYAQNTITIAVERLAPKVSNLSPMRGLKRLFGMKALFEFAKSIIKGIAVAAACYFVALPIYEDSAAYAMLDPAAFLHFVPSHIAIVLLTVALVAGVVAAIDLTFQRFEYMRRQRMSLQELKEEMRSTDGDPHFKSLRRSRQRKLAQRRMMAEVPKATVIITNPTHFAVALRYDRSRDAAPLCIAKGTDAVALRIRETAKEAGVPLMEDRPLARALHASTEIGDTIPREHFEAVAKIIGLIWSRAAATRRPGLG
jgi:flagellar biosynthetic protein FlhB